MQVLLAEMERAQKQAGAGESGGQSGSVSRLEQLEQQVKELTERRLQHLETLQSQQMEVQVRDLVESAGGGSGEGPCRVSRWRFR